MMFEFSVPLIHTRYSRWRDVEQWLWDNVGPGGIWLSKDEPSEGDRWGFYHRRDELICRIIDPQDAVLFQMRWM